MDDIVIYGAGGMGRDTAWLIEDINKVEPRFYIHGFLDDNAALAGKALNGYRIFEAGHFLQCYQGISVALAVGQPSARMAIAHRLSRYGFIYPNLIHPSAILGSASSIGSGNILCAGVILAANARIGSFCHLNLKTTVGHDGIMEDFSSTACGVDLAGYSHIGKAAYIGNHATVLPSVRVGDRAVVGAGAVVNRELPPNTVSVGVPARIIKPA